MECRSVQITVGGIGDQSRKVTHRVVKVCGSWIKLDE